ncbi:hypothetical protein [Variovorax sp. Sphag1AA]|uniref:hypothetical protein n=1 Tax=Variovorax sp. Sphag1AA TaxID=2587027 RepID=UPI0016178B2B|nr:hypothetical protein [Variovorax sp. Sphag1AA]MBB3180289.1 hypothetical protein [Variovorax sp. Sphag1AA]
MQPEVEISKRGEKNFIAYVGIGDGTQRYVREGLQSIAHCLSDAAAALGTEFRFATVSYERTRLGSYPVAVMAHRAHDVAEELLLKLANLQVAA